MNAIAHFFCFGRFKNPHLLGNLPVSNVIIVLFKGCKNHFFVTRPCSIFLVLKELK